LVPFAFQRIPPRSQIDRSNPHDRQRTIQARDSASIDVAQDRGGELGYQFLGPGHSHGITFAVRCLRENEVFD
jgi:hypothetical protein